MKTLYLIGGTMGVGKTTTVRELCELLPKSVFLDGDWCWDSHPFTVNDETKRLVMKNICFMLGGFISCTAFENIVFCWVMHEQSIIDEILSRLELNGVRVVPVSLICTKNALCERLEKDIASGLRKSDVVERSVQRIPLYDMLETIKIDVTDISAGNAAKVIAELQPLQ